MKKLGLYIHIPFCIKKCKYCDFISYESTPEDIINSYIKNLVTEIENKSEEASDYTVDSIFIGGGTPSIISESNIYSIMNAIHKNYKLDNIIEISIESNPKTLNKEKLQNYLDFGINRLSIGIQSFNDEDLKSLGRIHSVSDFHESYNFAREAGFKNINIDLMFSIPNQSVSNWMKNINEAMKIKPEHISFYSLKYEEDTVFYNMLMNGELKENDDESDRTMYWDAVNKLKENGYNHYEISNGALDGYECKHNLKYWSMEEFLGFGISASSFFMGQRYVNEKDLSTYINGIKTNKSIILDKHRNNEEDNISEFIFTGLRKLEGINIEKFKEYTKIDIFDRFEKEIEELTEQSLLELENQFLKLTPRGIDISNTVMSKFIL